MKKIKFLFLALPVLFSFHLHAQYTYTFNEANSGTWIRAPYNNSHQYGWSNIIYQDNVLDHIKGNIIKIAFRPSVGGLSDGTNMFVNNQTCYLREHYDDQFDNADYPDTNNYTRVFSGTVEWKNYEWSEIILDQPFSYNYFNLGILWFNKSGYTIFDGRNMLFTGMSDFPDDVIRQKYADGSFPEEAGDLQSSLPMIRITFESVTDIGIASIIEPVGVFQPLKDQDIKIVLKNYKPDSIYNAEIHWEIDGAPQPVFNWEDTLLYNQADTVTIGTVNLSKGDHTMKVWISSPNGTEDENHANDTVTTSLNCYYENTPGEYSTVNGSIPLDSRRYSWSSVIYTSEDIGGAGQITHIGYYNNGSSNSTITNQKIYIQKTGDDQFKDGSYPDIDSMQLVYSGEITWKAYQWSYIALDSVLEYNGSDNLIIHHENRYGTGVGAYSFRSKDMYPMITAKFAGYWPSFPGNGNTSTLKPLIKCRFEPLHSSDVAMNALTNPVSGVAPGMYEVMVEMVNYGTDQFTGADVYWEMNDVLQSQVNWSGALRYFERDTVTLDNYTFDPGIQKIMSWAQGLNTGTDLNSANDTLNKQFVICDNPYSGTYNIPSDFNTLSEALSILKVCGVDGHVTLELAPGSYEGQVLLYSIPGLSASQTLTITSTTGDSSDVILTSLSPDYTLKVQDVSNVCIKNITFKNNSTGYPLLIQDVDSMIINNNRIVSDTSFPSLLGMISTCSDIFITHNYFGKGQNGISCSAAGENIYVTGNIFDVQGTAIYNSGVVTSFFAARNIITATYGITLNNVSHLKLNNNRIDAKNRSLYLYECNANSNKKNIVYNNLLNGGNWDMSISQSKHTCFYYNTIKNHNTAISANSDSLIFKNNIIESYSGRIFSGLNDTRASTFDVDHNSYFFAGDDFSEYSFSYWQSHFGHDQHSDTLQVWFHEDGYHTHHYIINNKGVPIEIVTHDIDSNMRDTIHPDIGAVEFDGCESPLRGNYIIDAGGSGDFVSFSEAASAMKFCTIDSSINFFVMPGIYNEQFILSDSIYRAMATDRISFFSADNDSSSVMLTWDASAQENNYIAKLYDISYVTLSGFTFKTMDTLYSCALKMVDRTDHIVISNNHFEAPVVTHDNNQSSLIFKDNDLFTDYTDTSVMFYNNLFLNGSYGYYDYIDGGKSIYTVLSNNRFAGQYYCGIIAEFADSLSLLNNTFESNGLEHAYYYQLKIRQSKGFNLSGNYFVADHFNGSGAITSFYSTGNIVNNMIAFRYHEKHNGNVIYLNQDDMIHFIHNSIHLYGFNNNKKSTILHASNVDSIVVANNIFKNTTGGVLCNFLQSVSADPLYSNYNCFYGSGTLYKYADTDYDSLSLWKSSTGNDLNSIYTDPYFVSATDLQIYNPLLNGKALPVPGITKDFDGNPRHPSTPDIGAYEYDSLAFKMKEQYFACPGDTIIVDAGEGYDDYSWQNGDYSATTSAYYNDVGIGSDLYTVTVTTGGQDFSADATVNFIRPELSVMDDTAACEYSYVELRATSPDAVKYEWDGYPSHDSSVYRRYVVNNETYYTVKVFDTLGCTSTDSIKVITYKRPNNPTIQYSDNMLEADTDTATWYQWYCNAEMLDDTTAVITPKQTGFYQVKAYNHVCPGNISESYHVSSVGLDGETLDSPVVIYPNPATGDVYIDFGNNRNTETLYLIDMKGNTKKTSPVGHIGFLTLDISHYPPGEYVLRLILKSGKTIDNILIIQ